eukprot:1263916-Lingulodinium_polyedra.AAC.1
MCKPTRLYTYARAFTFIHPYTLFRADRISGIGTYRQSRAPGLKGCRRAKAGRSGTRRAPIRPCAYTPMRLYT